MLLVLLHDFPEFLCDYHYGFCDVIPPNCIQLRNLILSAFPRNMRLPDPFTPNLKVTPLCPCVGASGPTFRHEEPLLLLQVDMLSEINIAPRILTNFTGVMPSQFKKDLDSYLKTRSPVTFLSELRSNLQVGAERHRSRCVCLTEKLTTWFHPSGVQRTRKPVQHPADQRFSAVRGHAGHRSHPQQGQHPLHEHHHPLCTHGHLPEPGGGPGH